MLLDQFLAMFGCGFAPPPPPPRATYVSRSQVGGANTLPANKQCIQGGRVKFVCEVRQFMSKFLHSSNPRVLRMPLRRYVFVGDLALELLPFLMQIINVGALRDMQQTALCTPLIPWHANSSVLSMPLTNQLPAMGQGICWAGICHACLSRPGTDIDRVLPDCVAVSFLSPIYYYLQNVNQKVPLKMLAIRERELSVGAQTPIKKSPKGRFRKRKRGGRERDRTESYLCCKR